MPKTTFNAFQQRTVSSQAAKFISTFKGFDIPNFIPITNKMILRMRKQFQDGEDKVELDLIKRHHLKIEPVTYNNVPGLKITPENVIAGQGAIVNIHGGGFIMGTARDRNGLLAATETHLPVYSVNYTLSPEAAAPIALEEAQNFYAGVVNELGEQPVRVMGSSAGSTIAASMLVRAHAAGLKMPQVAILFCPALDISGDGDSTVFDSRRDAMSVHLSMRLAKTYIDKKDPHDPNLSPMYAEIGAWFPATYMTTGTRDMMISNVLRFTDKLKKANVPVGSTIKDGMWHGFTWEETLPEAIETRQDAWQFMAEHV
ncbi:alpha/beta hydrolase fold domain-containing protein [Secundilactobacillus silagei]|uniref:Alpha/beta hydrolase n=1 Tax=Secundilactobacillus silagei JCM 19001 TaxID=1302250 RepID=A0A1Z5IHS8_9LACO|nr:alpha/beta hydrolase fold domain-containing protein [Secundilactobacillus silagei]TDG67370.1 hypothetical protein C5L25_000966 [Secundilactobacillus silagei JCM 19001]GAX01313.1 alpha/beta hydrolase [Secundilactobacillus silagei JCM 19001]